MMHFRQATVTTFTRMGKKIGQQAISVSCTLLTVTGVLGFHTAQAQQFQALHGSPFAGSLSSDYNPAAVLDAPYRWDVTLFGVQGKVISNSFKVIHYNLFSNYQNAELKSTNGSFRRYAHASGSVNLLHAQYRINHRSAVSFGINLRSYFHGQASPFNYADTFRNAVDFVNHNRTGNGVPPFRGNGQSSSWLEYNLGYSRILRENELGRWQAGVQLRIMNSLAGGTGRVNNLYVVTDKTSANDYLLAQGNGYYGYSKNVDVLDSNQSFWSNYHNFMRGTLLNLGMDIGVEYVRYIDDYSSTYRPGALAAEYDWKIGISLLDIGKNTYEYGKYSMSFTGFQPNVRVSRLDSTFGHYHNLHDLNDSLRTIVSGYDSLRGRFSINNPTRLLVSFDKSLPNNFYVNAEVQFQFGSTRSLTHLNTRELLAVALTPRWETKTWGLYLPIQYTTEGNTWLGFAFKAGPLILGLHNVAWLFSKSSLPNGGGYLALQIHPWGNHEEDNSYPCPRYPR